MSRRRPVYFDNAATTWPKPTGVKAAVSRALEYAGGNPGRGAHSLSLEAARTVFDCREKLAGFFGFSRPENAVFTLNTTHALNIAIKCLIKPRSRVVTTSFEHNSVRRPLLSLGCAVTQVDMRLPKEQFLAAVERELRRGASAAVCSGASNVVPLALPSAELSALCRRYGAACVIDAAQCAGTADLRFDLIGADAVCFPGHKGLYGPMGCGVCVFGGGYEKAGALATVIEGGSGINSLEPGMPDLLPERFEAGTLPVPAIAGLSAGIDAIARRGREEIYEKELSLARRAREIIGNTNGAVLYDPPDGDGAVVLFGISGVSPEKTAAALDAAGICVRAGLHCAPDAHRSLGTLPYGAVRLSFGMYNTPEELEYFAGAVTGISKQGSGRSGR